MSAESANCLFSVYLSLDQGRLLKYQGLRCILSLCRCGRYIASVEAFFGLVNDNVALFASSEYGNCIKCCIQHQKHEEAP